MALAPDEVAAISRAATAPAQERDAFVALPLYPMEEEGRISTVHVRPMAVDAIEPLDPRELEAHRRDRETWIEHG